MRRSKRFLTCCLAAALLISLCACAAPAASQAPAQESAPAERTYAERLAHCKEQIEAVTDFRPEIVLVLGTGLGGSADGLDVKATIPYGEIEGWPVSTAPEHAGNLILAINCIPNMAAGMEDDGFTEDSIEETMAETAEDARTLFVNLLDDLAK